MITILACNPTFGAAYNLRKAFSLWEPTRLITLETHPLWAGEEDIILTLDSALECRRLVEDSRFTLMADAAGLKESLELLGGLGWASRQRWMAYWGDTTYWQNSAYYTGLAYEIGVRTTFAMMDIMQVAPKGTIPLCHPVEDIGHNPEKGQSLKVMHGPRTENKRLLKGSDKIERVMAEICGEFPGIGYQTLEGLVYRECLGLKKDAHIFIDQIPDPDMAAGLGRSGEEALTFGSIVLTSLYGQEYLNGFFPPPPVIPVYTEEQLYSGLRTLCQMDREEIEAKGRLSREWAEKYLLFEGWLEYVGRWLN